MPFRTILNFFMNIVNNHHNCTYNTTKLMRSSLKINNKSLILIIIYSFKLSKYVSLSNIHYRSPN